MIPAAPGNAFIPNWEPPARVVPDPLPGTKRYVLLNADGTMAGETDDLQEAVTVIGSGRVDLTMAERGYVPKRYIKVMPGEATLDTQILDWVRNNKRQADLE